MDRLRKVAGFLPPAILAVLALATSVGVPAALGATPITPVWMISSNAISLIDTYLGNDTLTTNAFDVSSTFFRGTAPSGWVVQQTKSFDAYGPATSSGSFLYALANNTISAGTTFVAYDNESWSMTPSNEQQDPGYYMAQFVQTAHQYGYKAVLTPSIDLTTVMPCYVSTDPSWTNYLTDCNLPVLAADAHPDVYEIQAQRYENDTTTSTNCGCYQWFVDQAVSEAAAVAPISEILAGLSTNPSGQTTTGQTLYTDTSDTDTAVAGYWLNVPVQSNSCPSCSPTGDPDVAANYLWLLGYVGPGSQAITFAAPASGSVGGSATLSAAGGPSGNPVVFSVDPSTPAGVCWVSGTDGSTVSYSGVGNCVIDANQAGDADWLAASQVSQTISVGQGSQTITFTSTPPANPTVGGSYTVGATASSGLPVTFSSATQAVCTMSGSTVSLVGVGTCTIDADQAGDANYAPAPTAAQSFSVAGLAAQKITFTSTPPSKATVGGSYIVSATASSGLPVTFSSATPSICTVSGSSGSSATVSFLAAGTCTIEADQAGDAQYAPAPTATQSLNVKPRHH